jgi:hypothetical protein
MMSRASTASQKVADEGAQWLSDPDMLAFRGNAHAGGKTTDSPFVSVFANPERGVMAGENQVNTIATGTLADGTPGVPRFQRAPHLATFEVPENLLYEPTLPHIARMEGELLFFGVDLTRYLVSAIANPFYRIFQ